MEQAVTNESRAHLVTGATGNVGGEVVRADQVGDRDQERGASVLSYAEQMRCPHAQNLIGVFGDTKPRDGKRRCNAPVCGLQIEGTGDDPGDVLISGGFTEDGGWAKLNGIRGDRADGLYLNPTQGEELLLPPEPSRRTRSRSLAITAM